MHSKRKTVLLGVAAVVVVLALIRFFWPDGLITLNFKNAPLSKVIASIEHQGGVRIGTNVPPETPVTIQMKRVPLMDALETLSIRVEGDLRVVYAGARTKTQAAAALEELKTGQPSEQWTVAWFPSMGMLFGSAPVDPRFLPVKPEAGDKNDLQSSLQQVAAKSGIMTAVPKEWNPTAPLPAKPAPASALVEQLITSAGGKVQESFLIIAREGREGWRNGPPGGPPGGPPNTAGAPPPPGGGRGWQGGGPGFNRDGMNPEWMAQRVEASIAQLPPEERAAAKADFDAMRKFWEEVRALPEDQRREKMAEFFNRPDVQEKMAERQAANDARRTPEQRAQRYQQYIQRKNQALKAPKS